MKKLFSIICYLFIIIPPGSAQATPLSAQLPGFSVSPYFNEQVRTFSYPPEVRIHINAPSIAAFDPSKPTGIALFALPNGNTIEQTTGKKLKPGDDWHYDIQHIGAQTRFLRARITEYNLVTAYLETSQKSWPTWRSQHADNAKLIKAIVDSLETIFAAYQPFLVLTGHSGGGSFTFGFLNGVSAIPNDIKRISFLDSNYGYDNSFGSKFVHWLNAAPDHYLSVIAYNDSVALYNGQPVVSQTGGTWYRSRMMVAFLANYFTFTTQADAEFIIHTALNGRIKFILKQNPNRAILHTVQVERNGFIQGLVSGTGAEGVDYVYYGERAYNQWIQPAIVLPDPLQIPPRPPNAMTGSQFMNAVMNMTLAERENRIFQEISSGNIPDFIRTLKKLTATFQDVDGSSHEVVYEVMPDYLAIGSNEDFCRIPMGPITAQKLANLFGATLPTAKLVDDIYRKAGLKLAPITYAPVGNQNELVPQFIRHNQEIEAQRLASGQPLGTLIGGIKKDVVISNKIIDPARPNHVVIYGWHKLDGTPIQPLTNIHIDSYVDYSHGIRFLNAEMLVDSTVMTCTQILLHPRLYKILSNEAQPMSQPSYLKDSRLPVPPKSWGIQSDGINGLRLLIQPDTSIVAYTAWLSRDGIHFTDSVRLAPTQLRINGLPVDSITFLRLTATNTMGTSAPTEVLAGVADANPARVLIVNGFDRASAGNTFNFIRQHGAALLANGYSFASATNEAITEGLINLADFDLVDYILGDESTADETFSFAEQSRIRSFLRNGGNLLVSGSEIAWDLDYKGSVSDQDFIRNFLKMSYRADAPNNQSGVFYQAEVLGGTPFAGLPRFRFDDGSHGTINVKWPDVVQGSAGGRGFIRYVGLDTSAGFGGIYFDGLFPGGNQPGKLVALGFPFESIYPDSIRNMLMGKFIHFFSLPTEIMTPKATSPPLSYQLYQNYPNPFNASTIIRYSLPVTAQAQLKLFDVLGREIATLVDMPQPAGSHSFYLALTNWPFSESLCTGIYFYRLRAGNYSQTRKMTVVK